MKKVIKLGLAALLSVNFMTAQAQNTNTGNDNSLLWEVSGNGLSKPSYIAGTFHILCNRDFDIKPKVWNALNQSENFVTEINYTDQNEMASIQKMMNADKKISEQLTPEEAKDLDKILAEYGTTLKNVDSHSSAALYSLVATKAVPCPQNEVKMYEIELLKTALKNKKTVGGLEKVDEQTYAISQAYDLKEAILQLKQGNQYTVAVKKMAEAFKNEDLKQLDKLIKDPKFMNKRQEKLVLTDRNRNWAEKMPEIMKKQSSFFAVGSGHLWGDNGLINLLKSKGYTVKPVSNL
ncbi:TraB/GumN family protein [Chryseobacterium arthrosphaerae]|uniref:TraB/GumN family protein n=1 Tax=Chryseobacterium arthrosphaerae TaxID=651561 RepID=UPI001BAEA8A4|nr:TraB/GumN family protein [Chryseobacterium arthrosphaerae]QUY54999.1 TraB/GumN family protein [Chryseobacterium arthrosphaerae]